MHMCYEYKTGESKLMFRKQLLVRAIEQVKMKSLNLSSKLCGLFQRNCNLITINARAKRNKAEKIYNRP